MTTLPDRLTAERDAAFAASRCQCATDEACRELAKLHAEVAKLRDTCGTGAGCLHKDATIDCLREKLELAEVVRASQVEGLTQGAAGWRERANQLEAEVAGLREDAARYRWLREKQAYIGIHPHYKDLPIEQRSGWTIRLVPDVKNSFDAAIDAARKGTT